MLDFLLEALHEGEGAFIQGPYNKDRTTFRVYTLKSRIPEALISSSVDIQLSLVYALAAIPEGLSTLAKNLLAFQLWEDCMSYLLSYRDTKPKP